MSDILFIGILSLQIVYVLTGAALCLSAIQCQCEQGTALSGIEVLANAVCLILAWPFRLHRVSLAENTIIIRLIRWPRI